jgi:hypothetical protein
MKSLNEHKSAIPYAKYKIIFVTSSSKNSKVFCSANPLGREGNSISLYEEETALFI